jgi:RimJ/RimL family protein N-acetyltransferase
MARRLEALELVGVRACLRLHRPEDAAPAYALLAGCDEILRWLVWDGPGSTAELAGYYSSWCFVGSDGCDLRLAIEERSSRALAGSLSLRFRGPPGQGDVGYWVGLPFQGRGLGREALELAARLAFQHLAAHSLVAWVFVGNEASRRVLERVGFTLARTVPGRIRKRGVRVDEWHFVLLAAEWRRRRARLEPEQERVSWVEGPASPDLDSPSRPFPVG